MLDCRGEPGHILCIDCNQDRYLKKRDLYDFFCSVTYLTSLHGRSFVNECG